MTVNIEHIATDPAAMCTYNVIIIISVCDNYSNIIDLGAISIKHTPHQYEL